MKTPLLETIKELTLAGLLGAVALSINVLREIAKDVTEIKVMMAGQNEKTAEAAHRLDRLEAKIFH